MGLFFTRFSDLLTQVERERLAELKKNGLPEYMRYNVDMAGSDYWKNFHLANHIAAYICVDEPFERQQEVAALLERNQKKSRRQKALLGILFWLVALYAVVKLFSWLF